MTQRGMTLVEILVTLFIASLIAVLLASAQTSLHSVTRALAGPSRGHVVSDLNRLERFLTGSFQPGITPSFTLERLEQGASRCSWTASIGGRSAQSGVNDLANICLTVSKTGDALLTLESTDGTDDISESIFRGSSRIAIECLTETQEWADQWSDTPQIPIAVRIRINVTGQAEVIERIIPLTGGLFP